MNTNVASVLKKNRRIIITDALLMLATIILCGGIFLFFKGFFDVKPSDFTIEILAALMGSIITVLITMLLIRRQGNIRQVQAAASASMTKVFETKLGLYREFIAEYICAALDGHLDADELGKLEELALTVTLLSRKASLNERDSDLGRVICGFVLQLQLFGLAKEVPESKYHLYDRHFGENVAENESRRLYSVVDIIKLMKIELGTAQAIEYSKQELEDKSEFDWCEELLDYRDYRDYRSNEQS